MQISLEGQTVLVTGGARRIGRAIALECARSGANVAVTYRSSEAEARECVAELQAAAPERCFAAYRVELTASREVQSLAGNIVRDLGEVTALVNNAAIFRRTPLDMLSEQDFDDHIAANLKAPFLTSQVFGALFLQQGGGHIVNFSDIYGLRPLANYLPYCISKAGVVMLTQTFAKALAPLVRVNCICPGTILPPSEPQGEMDSEAELVKRIPMQRLGSPEEVAQAVVFLLGGPQFVTGAILPVDGGQILR